MNGEFALKELSEASSLINHWKFLPGAQIKMVLTHLLKALDSVSSFVLNSDSILERDYLVVSSVRLFDDPEVEGLFYDTYFYIANLLRRNVYRVNEEVVRLSSDKHAINANKSYFEELIGTVDLVVSKAFN